MPQMQSDVMSKQPFMINPTSTTTAQHHEEVEESLSLIDKEKNL